MRMIYALSLVLLVVIVESKTYSPIGGNLAGAIDWNPSAIYVNHLYNMRRLGSANAPWDGAGMTYDHNGNPMQDWGLYLLGVNTEPQEYIGNWSISFTGRGRISCSNGPSIPYQQYNATTNTVSAIMTVSKGQWVFWCTVTNTTGTTKDIKWIRPGYDINDYPTFTKSYLAQYNGWNTFRFMDWFSTNGNGLVNWVDRPSDKDVQNVRGVPYEYAIELCNILNTNAWINIPSNATDDYVTQMAQLFKAKLNPNLILHVEYSNELWNFLFIQSHWNLDFAEEEVARNASSGLNWDGIGINYHWAYRRQITRAAEISDLFRAVYGDCAMGKTVRVTAASQFTFSSLYDGGLSTVNHNYGPPNHYFSHCSGAPYFDLGQYHDSNTVTVDQLLDEFKVTSQSYNSTYIADLTYCRYYGLDFVSYEGGPATYPATQHGYTVAGSAIMDPRFQSTVEDFLKTWYTYGNGLFMYYMFGTGGQVSQYGAWDIAADPFNYTASPKWRAVENIRDNYDIPEISTIGHMLPDDIGFSSPFRVDAGRGYKVLFNSPTPFGANYTITSINVSCWTSFPTEIWVNNKIVLNITAGVPCYGIESTYNATYNATATFAVPPGDNVMYFNDKRITSADIVLSSAASSRVYPVKEPIFYDSDPCSGQTPAASTTASSTGLSSGSSTGEASGAAMIVISMVAIACSILVL